ncbi:hypothetical protein EDD80_10362 [Anseongella ginsenosidimutans]|uniref:Spermatogenesis-associated protein 20-like TRX domain-containing protein n=1 Tax=Anseongella ginsenosidimutans TaxID=496056 RepID=A0A4R3KW86_9SPHI|nr:thioredoxin domain-containing protein [Anseongella ginsenosidimutans]QEC53323.1 thioredoxin domain-containing protein [Anseongella ginsenosidimutans]TCS88201.1 hypothetical protein EDD80_10362 [Anseongella ginsenosidimutans]
MAKFTNSLINESSPYLLQHAHNPVNWYAWGPEALEKAKREDKLLLVSIGYSSCHWCHVMEHESFEDEEIAQIMNERYVCVKVDREERPDIDQVYMNAVQLMTGQGGWPLNCFTLPDQRPVYGGTYFRPEDWKSLLMNLDDFFRKKRTEAEAYAGKLTAGIRQSEQVLLVETEKEFSSQDLREIYEPWLQYFDFREGGHARAPKFPLPNNFLFLLRYAYHSGEASAEKILQLTLDKMCRGGIYDQLGGGFSRYSVDAQWHVPHFEKMLYDNGQLVSLYSEGFTYSRSELYRQTVYETLEFIEREMTSPEGGFYSALDADSEGVEGKFYCWTKEEIEKARLDQQPGAGQGKTRTVPGTEVETGTEAGTGVGTESGTAGRTGTGNDGVPGNEAVFCTYYNITREGNWEGTNILRRLHSDGEIARQYGISPVELGNIVSEGKKKLMQLRQQRVRPGLDDKILASWNGIMLKGYLDAYRAFGEERFMIRALKNAQFLKSNLFRGDDELFRSFKDGKVAISGFLDDYAFVSDAFIALYEATFDEQWLQLARGLAERALQDFYNAESGMFFYTSVRGEPLIDRKYELMDNVIPSSNSTMANVLHRLGLIFDEPRYLRISRQMLRNVMEPMKGYGSAYSNWAILLQHQVAGMYEVAITGPEAIGKRKELDKSYIPNKILLGGEKGTLPLLDGKFTRQTMIYVCRNKTCQLPVSEAGKALDQMRSQG